MINKLRQMSLKLGASVEDEKIRIALETLSRNKNKLIDSVKGLDIELPNTFYQLELPSAIDILCCAYGISSFESDPVSVIEEPQPDGGVSIDPESLGVDWSAGKQVMVKSRVNQIASTNNNPSDFRPVIGRVYSNGDMFLYKNPVDEKGKPYEVPFVVKNRDYLTGLIDGVNGCANFVYSEADPATGLLLRRWFSDILPYSSYTFSEIVGRDERLTEEKIGEINQHCQDILEDYKSAIGYEDEDEDDGDFIIPKESNQTTYDLEVDIDELPYFQVGCPNCPDHIRLEKDNIPPEAIMCPTCGSVVVDYTYHENSKNHYVTSESVRYE